MKLQIKKLVPNAIIPTRGSQMSAGYDLYAYKEGGGEYIIGPHQTELVRTGLSIALPDGYFSALFARSGLATKEGLRPANCVGICDADYRGEYMVALHNDSERIRTVGNGERIAQLVVLPYQALEFEEVDTLPDTERGVGGFGSTGKN